MNTEPAALKTIRVGVCAFCGRVWRWAQSRCRCGSGVYVWTQDEIPQACVAHGRSDCNRCTPHDHVWTQVELEKARHEARQLRRDLGWEIDDRPSELGQDKS